tara:strand:- start:2100 stop:3185 length:1086 start_codon:yes stop_codon:yes gene_type:complete
MAVTDITASVLAITTATPTANSIEDAQRFVVASIPKNLLKWASTFTVPSNHGGNTSDGVKITMPTATDSILDVSRNGFSATEVPYDMKGFIANTASLHLATSTYPKYYLDDTNSGEGVRIIVKPIPTDSATAVALYVDFNKIDDDCDLRNVVINYATSKEFTELAAASTFPTLTWPSESVPVAPPSPSFTTPDITTVTAPTFTPPVMSSLDFADTNNWIATEEDSEMLASRVQEIQSKIGEFSALLQSAQADFNRNNTEYQSLVQEAQQETSLLLNQESQEYSSKLQKYQAELQEYQARVNETVQINQGQIAAWQAENGVKLNHYVQLATQYYNWAITEIKTYIENNPKTFDKVMEMQKGK